MVLIKRALETVTPLQLLAGFLEFRATAISLSQFLKNEGDWLLADELVAEAEVAIWVNEGKTPECYYLYMDLRDESINDARVYAEMETARQQLREWCDAILAYPARISGKRPPGRSGRLTGTLSPDS